MIQWGGHLKGHGFLWGCQRYMEVRAKSHPAPSSKVVTNSRKMWSAIDKRLGGCAFPEGVQLRSSFGVLIIPSFPATSRKVPKYTYIRSKKVTQFRFLPFPSCSILFRLEDQAQGFSLALQIHKLHYLEMWAPPCFGTPTQRHLRSLRQTGGSAPDFTSRRSNQRTAKRLLGTEIRAVWFMPWNWYTAKSQMCLKWTTNYIKPTRQFYVCFRPDWSHRLPKSGDIEKVATLTNVGLKSFSHTPGRCSNRPW